MRFIIGDELGLLKVVPFNIASKLPGSNGGRKTDIDDRKKALTSLFSAKKPTGQEQQVPAPSAAPKATNSPIIIGQPSKQNAITLLAKTTMSVGIAGVESEDDHAIVACARANGIIDFVSLSSGESISTFHVLKSVSLEKLNKHRKPEHFVGLAQVDGLLISCSDTGIVSYIHCDKHSNTHDINEGTFSLGQDLIQVMKVHPTFPNIFATGGDERDVCIWDIKKLNSTTANGTSEELPVLTPIWKAKNVSNTILELRVPIWVSDLCWSSLESSSQLVTGTRYSHIRFYDSQKQRKPTSSFEFGTFPVQCLATSPDGNEIVFADNAGNLTAIDAQSGRVLGKFLGGISGAVVQIHYCKKRPLIVVIGVDRHLRVFEAFEKRRLVLSLYMKTRLTSLVVDEDWTDPAVFSANGLGEEELWNDIEQINEDDLDDGQDDDDWLHVDRPEEDDEDEEEIQRGKNVSDSGSKSNGALHEHKKRKF